MLEVVKECLEHAQASRLWLLNYGEGIPNSALGERIVQHERMLTHLLAAVAYIAGDDGYKVLFETPPYADLTPVKGIGVDPI